MDGLEKLFEAIMDAPLKTEAFDEEQFKASLAAQREECERHFREYCKNERWSYVP